MKTFITLILAFFALPLSVWSQGIIEKVPPNYIRTVIFNSGNSYSGVPVIELGTGLNLEFDDIIGDEANYYYTIEHYNYDWTPSQLVKSEYMEGFDNVRIVNYQNSYNTLQLYSHYRLNIPNEDTQRLKVSGNYMLKVFNEARELIFSRKFIIYQPLTSVAVEIKKSRDVRFIHTKQVVNFSVNSPDFIIRNPEESVRAVILQNNNLKTGIYNIKPQYNIGNELIYKYDQPTAFWAGNEFLNFDSKDLRAATVKIRSIEVKDLYHHYLFRDQIRAFEPYTYNPDINGKFVVRTMQGRDNSIEAGYVWTHFALQTTEKFDEEEVHLYGGFNNFILDDSTRLEYNPLTGTYETARLFKQGYYDYKYVLLRKDGMLDEGFFSGNFTSTENDYTVIIYYHPPGARFSRVIGVGNQNSVTISN